jgi:ubiquinone/menaquinone biosynthesis C-methylase UbiE
MNKYSEMQKNYYETDAHLWSPENRDAVVGGFDLHNMWEDYNVYLFKDITDLKSKICLDFGCGPGRNLAKYSSTFKELHGVDISQKNLDNAVLWLEHNNCNLEKHKLYLCNGYDLSEIPSKTYNVIMSTICFQHICVHEVRFNLLKEFHRILKPGGIITMQMGFGPETPTKNSVSYDSNYYDASSTNGGMDTRVESPDELKNDLEQIGFTNFNHYIAATGPGDGHPNWIFFNAQKK